MLPEHMPYYRGPKVQLPAPEAAVEASHVQTLAALADVDATATSLSTLPIQFGGFPEGTAIAGQPSRRRYNSELACYALQTYQFLWAVYNFSNGHFTSTIDSTNLSF